MAAIWNSWVEGVKLEPFTCWQCRLRKKGRWRCLYSHIQTNAAKLYDLWKTRFLHLSTSAFVCLFIRHIIRCFFVYKTGSNWLGAWHSHGLQQRYCLQAWASLGCSGRAVAGWSLAVFVSLAGWAIHISRSKFSTWVRVMVNRCLSVWMQPGWYKS